MESKINTYLTALRDSGRINMFGATPYLMERFGLTRKQASVALLDWMATFKQEKSNA